MAHDLGTPIFISFFCKLVSDQFLIAVGSASVGMKLERLWASACSCRHTMLALNDLHNSRGWLHFLPLHMPKLLPSNLSAYAKNTELLLTLGSLRCKHAKELYR